MKAARFATLLFMTFAACYSPRSVENPPKEEKKTSARISLESDPSTLDPRKVRDLGAVVVAHMLFEGLVAMNPSGKVEMALAERVDISQDLKTYTFYLRQSYWSNGDAVTAEDFVYAWKTVLNPLFPADNAFQLFVIKGAKEAKLRKAPLENIGVNALNPHTLMIELESPVSYFLELATLPVFFPVNRHVDVQNPNWHTEASSLVNNGPFSLHEWQHNHELILKKNPFYWDVNKISLEEVDLSVVTEETALKMFEKKELDWIGSPLSTLPVDALPHLRKQKEIRENVSLGTSFIRCNVEHPVLSSKKLRHALARAMNRKELTTHVLQGDQIPSTGLVPTKMGFQEIPCFQDGHLQEAKFLFSEAMHDLALEEKPELTLMYANGIRTHLLAQALQQQWERALGIRIKLEALENKVYFDRISKQDYVLAICSWLADFYDPINFLEIFKYKTTGTNNTGWEHPEYTRLLEASIQEVDPKKRREFLIQSEMILMEAMPIIPIYEHRMLYMISEYLPQIRLTPIGRFYFKENPL